MFSAPVIELLDREIERLQAARDILASLLPSRPASQRTRRSAAPVIEVVLHKEEVRPADGPAEVVATVLKSRKAPQRRQATRRRASVDSAPRALGGQFPDRPIVVQAHALEHQARPERTKAAESSVQADSLPGTLDALVRELAERRTLAVGTAT